jgi:hypothetical protein
MLINVRHFNKEVAAQNGDVTNNPRTQNSEIKNG